MEAAGGAAALRAAFDELLVFEQDFDTAMQILMFQDEKVARLSLEDAEHARSRRRATRNRGAARSPSRKRRRTGASQSARADPPSPPLSGFTQSSETWSLTASAEASLVVDASASDFLAAATSTQMSENGKIAQENEVEESVALSAATQPAGGDMSGAGGAGRGGSSTMVTSLFTTGSGRAVSVSKERLQAYETKLQAAEESVALSAATQPAGGDMSGAGGAGRGGSSTMVTSLFTTGSGRAVSVSKERLQAYETKLQAAEESVALSAATQPAGGDMSGAGGAGRGGSSTMVTSLFTTGSGRAVSVSKERLQAYETKLQAAEESVALSAATQPAGGDMSGAGGAGRDGSSTMVTSLFTTGSGRAVSVSKERLQAYETKLQAAEESVALSAATQPAGGDMSGAGGAGRDGSSTMVTSLFTTGSGRAVSVSKERLQAYETKLQAAEESVALSAATQPAGGDMSGAGGAGRGGSSTMVTSLFTTGSGRAVSVSKERLQAYETKLQAAEESVALSAATQPAGGDMSGAGGAGRDGSSTMVTSLFTTGSGRAVSVSKERLQAYETKLQAAEESVALSAATQPAGGDMSGAGGAGRGGSSTMVTSLFTTGSGRAVSVSKERLQAYETKLQAAEESVALSAATQPAGGDMSGAGGAGRDGSSTMVTSLFTTGSGRAVSVSKERLQAYETKLQAAEESVALSAATQPAGGDMSGAGGAGRGGSSTMVTSLFTTGSGRAVSVSKERLQAYETKLQAAEESVALSAATQPAGGDMSGAGGAGRGGSSTMVTSLFTTGSGRAVSVSKERLQAYETKLQAAEESVALSAATQPAGGDMSGAGGAGRGGSSTMVTSLFTTGSGRAVSVSKERLQAYETKLQAAEESVALSAATQPAGGDMSGAGGAGRDGSSTMVTSLFTTGSGRAVSVSKERLQAYETKLQAAEDLPVAI
ncbi:hypothetical protein PHYSODRAFT_335627 [Phytophthora sojae]|uniref:Uncharacterized protein n=1 Tax=Phytophthora sojae (strain P6497) TaxID=1094619 RepID=G4ZRE3_PHYSP|nr:hypothetical protein PHYSODRAFT_335627 [Phytophthora sojae]EGZ13935.1 hypothetical protein PHYSODRAFT_335627 [Phytophthora sojae]|eukprot:XP_009531364.1 hypothetical protein PHYSODRAFT_335627 [Phytophthora sojae]